MMGDMSKKTPTTEELLIQLKDVRGRALEHARAARALAYERRQIIGQLLAMGLSQSDLARELDVSRQAIQKMATLD